MAKALKVSRFRTILRSRIGLLVEISGGERKGGPKGRVPIFPIVDAVPDSELILDPLLHHLHVEFEGKLHEIVVIAAVEEPLDAAQGLQCGIIGFIDIVKG